MKKLLISLFTSLSLLAAVPAPLAVAASPFSGSKDAVCSGIVLEEGKTCDQVSAGAKNPNDAVKTALNIFSSVIGIIGVVMFILAGLKYITSQGDAAGVNSARNTALYAAIGLVVVALSQLIVRFVLVKFRT